MRRKKIVHFVFFLILLLVYTNVLNVASPSPVISNLPRSNDYFTGREENLSQIKALFEAGKHPVVIAGFLGMGKTRTARKFAELHLNKYDIVWFLDATKSISDQYKMLASHLNEAHWLNKDHHINLSAQASVLLEKINEFLHSTPKKWLIIFDNVQNREEILSFLPPSPGHILITTRNEEGWKNVVKMSKFKREESISLLKKLTSFEDAVHLDKLAALLSDHPLSLIQAICYICKHFLENAEAYCELYSKRRKDLWKREEDLLTKDQDLKSIHDNYQMTGETALRLSLEKLKNQSSLSWNLYAHKTMGLVPWMKRSSYL